MKILDECSFSVLVSSRGDQVAMVELCYDVSTMESGSRRLDGDGSFLKYFIKAKNTWCTVDSQH